MSATEWNPGDVALVEAGCWANRKVALRLHEGWSHTNGVSLDSDGVVSPLRRLVVLDPESDEDVRRLSDALRTVETSGELPEEPMNFHALKVRAALRELANPTPAKSDEPTGLGAVVEDRDGDRWVRVNTSTGTAEWRSTNYLGQTARWTQIPAVRVLSEGVPE